jgi:hypothetical protein
MADPTGAGLGTFIGAHPREPRHPHVRLWRRDSVFRYRYSWASAGLDDLANSWLQNSAKDRDIAESRTCLWIRRDTSESILDFIWANQWPQTEPVAWCREIGAVLESLQL